MVLKRLIVGVMMVTGVIGVCLTKVVTNIKYLSHQTQSCDKYEVCVSPGSKWAEGGEMKTFCIQLLPAEMGSNKLNFQRMFPYRKTENTQQQT